MHITQKSLPNSAFRPCCGRRTDLRHAASCPTLAPTPVAPAPAPAPAPATDRGPITIQRTGARVVCTRATGTVTLRFRVTSVAKKAERAIREGGHTKLDEMVALMQAGLWS